MLCPKFRLSSTEILDKTYPIKNLHIDYSVSTQKGILFYVYYIEIFYKICASIVLNFLHYIHTDASVILKELKMLPILKRRELG